MDSKTKEQPYNKVLTPNDLNDFLKLRGSLVVSTGCSTGTNEFAKAFLDNGASGYIAPNDDPEGTSAFLFVINFYYHLVVKNKTPDEALELAKRADKENMDMFLYFAKV